MAIAETIRMVYTSISSSSSHFAKVSFSCCKNKSGRFGRANCRSKTRRNRVILNSWKRESERTPSQCGGADTRVNLSTSKRERRWFNGIIVTLSGAADKTYSLTLPLNFLGPAREIQESTQRHKTLNKSGAVKSAKDVR